MKFNVVSAIHREIGRRDIRVRTVTRCKVTDFAAGASDMDAVYALSGLHEADERFEVRIDNLLHAKIFVFDERIAYIGSSNITFSGLQRNYEAVVAIEDGEFLGNLTKEAERYWHGATPASTEMLDGAVVRLRSYVRTTSVQRVTEEHYLSPPPVDDKVSEPTVAQEQALAELAEAEAQSEAREPSFVGVPRITEVAQSRKIDLIEGFSGFLSILRHRFGIELDRREHGLALAVHILDFATYENACRSEDMRALVDDAVPKTVFTALRGIGRAIWDFGVMAIASRSGLLRRFGPGGASMLGSAALTRGLLDVLWDQNLLDPPWFLYLEAQPKPAKTFAAFRLFGLVAVLRGPMAATQLVQEFFDPTDLFGDDLAETSDLKGSKMMLQEVAQSRGRTVSYADHASIGESHNSTWICECRMGGMPPARGEGLTKGASESDAASRMLRHMWSDPTWRTSLLLERQRAADVTKRSGPWRVAIDLPDVDEVPRICDRFRVETNLDLPDEVVFPAFVDGHLKKKLRLNFDNQALAYIGSTAVNVAVWLYAHRRGLSRPEDFLRQVWGQLGSIVRVDAVWASVDANRTITDAIRTTVIQAIAGGLVVRYGGGRAIEMLEELIGRISHTEASATSVVSTGTDVLVAVSPSFQDGMSYTEQLQRVAQAYAELPRYGFTQSGVGHAPVFVSIVSLLGHSARAEGMTKRGARNRAAFELLLKLKQESGEGRLAPPAPAAVEADPASTDPTTPS